MTDFTPSQLNRMDTTRLAAYRMNLDFYNGSQWRQTSRHRQLVFNYVKVSIDKVTSFLMPGLGFACYPGEEADELRARVRKAEQFLRQVYEQNNLQQLDYETSEAGTYWIDSWEYQSVSLRGGSRSNLSTLTLYCLDGWGLTDRWNARYQMRWNKDDVNPKSVWQILYQLLARAGIKLTNTPAKPQSSAINNFYPDFTVNPGTRGDVAIRRLLGFVPDKLVLRGQEAFTKDPLADEESCYSYGTDHAILSGKYTEAVTVSRARAIGRDSGENRILEEALDWDFLALAIDQLEQNYDPNLQTAARAQERAATILREASLRAEHGNLVIPTNVGQELLDIVEVTDERCWISQVNYRVQGIRTLYDHRKGQYEQMLTLGAP